MPNWDWNWKPPAPEDPWVLVWVVDVHNGSRHIECRRLSEAKGLERVKL